MIEEKKTVELIMDPHTYSQEEMIENIENAICEFSNKEVRVTIAINEWGVYVVTLDYMDKDTRINKMKYRRKLNKKKKVLKRYKEKIREMLEETQNQIENTVLTSQVLTMPKYKNKDYGVYKETGIYRPY